MAASQSAIAGREVYAVHVLHADELRPPRKSALLADPENADFERPLTERTRRQYLDSFGEWRSELARSWRMRGAYYSEASTNEQVTHIIRRVVRGLSDPGVGR